MYPTDQQYFVDVFDDRGNQRASLAQASTLGMARAAFFAAIKAWPDAPNQHVYLRQRARVIARSDRPKELAEWMAANDEGPIPILSVPMKEPPEALQPPQDEALYVIFDRAPGHEPPRLVDVEDAQGRSVNVGEWVERPDGTCALRLLRP